MTNKDYATIQRLLGQIEGAASCISNDEIQQLLFDACTGLDKIIDKYEPKEVVGIG
jgi:hypothetical protein